MQPQIVILAGGLGTRLWPLTEKVPKALIEIAGRPFVHWQLEWLAACGIRDVILSVGYLGHLIEAAVGDGSRWGVQVQYAFEGEVLRGTGGALRFVLDQGLLKEKFLVTYGDSYLPIDFMDVWTCFTQSGKSGLMTVLKNEEKWDASNAVFNGSEVVLYDKRKGIDKPPGMTFIDYGLLGLCREAVQSEYAPGQKADLADLLHRLSVQGDLAGYEVKSRFYEIGSVSGIQDLNHLLERSHP